MLKNFCTEKRNPRLPASAMLSMSRLGSVQKSPESSPSAPCTLWPVDLKLTHLACKPNETLIHFQAQYLTVCELDYNILQVEIQNTPKSKATVNVEDLCLVEDVISAHWHRGRVHNIQGDVFDVFLIDHGNVVSVGIDHLSSCSNDLFSLPPKIVCGFFANVLPIQDHWDPVLEKYLLHLIGTNVKGYIHALLPHKILILEVPDINKDLIKLGFGKHVDTNTFLLLVEMLTDVPLKQSIEPVPDLLIDQPSGQKICFKPSSIQGFEDIQSFSGPRLSAGTMVKVRVTAAVKPWLFYCQVNNMTVDLQALSEKLAVTHESRSIDPSQTPSEHLGLLCSVKGRDEKWYRGFVRFLPVQSHVRVLFVDYGFYESVPVENIHRLPPEFLSTPIMTFPCSLSCLNETNEAVTTRQLSFLKEGLLGRLLVAEIKGFDEEQNLYSITVLNTEEDFMSDPKSVQDISELNNEPVFDSDQMLPEGGYLFYESCMARTLDMAAQVEEIQVDTVFEGYVEHSQNPNNFSIRTQRRNHDFEVMMDNIADHFSKMKLEDDVLEDPEIGAFCFAMYEKDMHFYRAVVIDLLEHGAEVLFIDFGNIEKVPHVLIKKIPEKFAREPAFAIRCGLVNVIPKDEVWTMATVDFFRRAVSNKALQVHVDHIRSGKLIVNLHVKGNENIQSISELLISSENAEYCRSTPLESNMHTETTAKVKKVKHPKNSLNQTKTWSKNTTQCEQNWEEAEEVNTAVPLINSTPAIAMMQAPATFKPCTFQPGTDFAVCCTHINSPSDFWCQLLNKIPELDKLMNEIQQFYKTRTIPIQPNVLCCVAKSPDDGRWYRAWIARKQGNVAKVVLVDYGKTVHVKEDSLQTILPQHLELESQAFRCSLYNRIEPVKCDPKSDSVWNTAACNSLKNFVLVNADCLRCEIFSLLMMKTTGLCNVVDLYNAQTKQSITKSLVEQGLATEVKISSMAWSSVCPVSFTYSAFNLGAGSEEQVYVTHVNSPWEIYCQLDKNTEEMEKILEMVSVESDTLTQTNNEESAGKLYMARYFDGKWYRCAMQPVQSPLHHTVFFVDYGNMHITEKTNVKPIPRNSNELLYTPMQAVKCSLAQIPNGEMYADVKQWFEETILNKPLRAVVGGKSEDGSFIIELFDGDLHINKEVKQLIASLTPKPEKPVSTDDTNDTPRANKRKDLQTPEKNHRCQQHKRPCAPTHSDVQSTCHKKKEKQGDTSTSEQQPCRAEIPKQTSCPKASAHYHVRKTCHRNKEKQSSVPIQSKPKEKEVNRSVPIQSKPKEKEVNERKQCDRNITQEQQQCQEEMPTCNTPQQQLCQAEMPICITPEQQPCQGEMPSCITPEPQSCQAKIPQLCSLPDKVAVGLSALCYVSHIDTVDSFFLQIQDDEPALLKIGEYLNSDTFRDSLKVVSEDLTLNDLILAEYEEDGALYRAVVKGYETSSRIKVQFVDYGNSAEVAKEKIYYMTEDCLSRPRFSIACSLVARLTYDSDASFTEDVMGKPLIVDFVGQFGAQWEVELKISDGKTHPVALKETAEKEIDMEIDTPAFSMNSAKLEMHTGCDQSSFTIEQDMIQSRAESDKEMLPTEVEKPVLKSGHATPSTEHDLDTYNQSSPSQKQAPNVHDSECVGKPNNTTESVEAEEDTMGVVAHLINQPSETEDVILLSVLPNGEFCVRLIKTADMFTALQRRIAENLHKCGMVAEGNIIKGLRCLLSTHRDNKWYRGTVQHVDQGRCSVFLMDQGITEDITFDSLRELDDDLAQIPGLAVRCKLNSIGLLMTKDCQETLRKMKGKVLKLVFVSYSKDDNLWKVEIVMNELFIQQMMGITSQQPTEKETSPPSSTDPRKMMVGEDKESSVDPGPAQHLIFAPINLNQAYCGFAAAVTTPFQFFVALEDLEDLQMVSAILDDLAEEMSPLPEAHLVPGSCCLVRSLNKWCRAEVISADTTVVTNLVDYGHYIDLAYEDRTKLKRLPDKLIRLPKVTYPCVLSGVEPVGVGSQWTDESLEFFQECLYQKDLKILFRAFVPETHWEVDILTEGVHVAKKLVDAGHASYIDVMLRERFQEQSACTAPPQSAMVNPSSKDHGLVDADGITSLETAEDHKLPTASKCSLM